MPQRWEKGISMSQNQHATNTISARKKPTNWGTKAADVLGNFFYFNRQTRIFWLQWLHNAYQFKVLQNLLPFCCRNILSGRFEFPNFGGLESVQQLKARPRLPNTSQYKGLLYLLPFHRIPMSNNGAPNLRHPPTFGPSRKWHQSKCRPHIPIRLLYTL